MKKSLIALAALATVATAAQAQSSVTVYGVLDAGVATIDKVGSNSASWTGMANGGLATSRIGFTGSEDLGGGLKANFKLESQLFPANGIAGSNSKATVDNSQSATVNTSSLFNRESTVGLSGGFGSVKFGRANTVAYDKAIALDPMGYGNFGAVGSFSPAFIARVNNQIKYASPVFEGLQADLAYSTQGVAGSASQGQTQELALTYANQSLKLIAAYGQTKTLLDTADLQNDFSAQYGAGAVGGVKGYENYQLGAVYTVGNLTFNVGYSSKKDKSAAAGVAQNAKELYFGGIGYAFTPTSKLTIAYYDYNNKTKATQGKSNMTSAQYVYSLSKRTDVYGIAAVMNNQDQVQLTIGDNSNIYAATNTGVTPANGKDQTGFMVGIRHKF